MSESDIKDEIRLAVISGSLHVSHFSLSFFPDLILQGGLEKLIRLDVSFNNLVKIPKEITLLTSLKELWLQHNPIIELPASISGCVGLEVIDIRDTKISDLPPSVSLLKKLHEVDWRGTPLEETLMEKCNVATGDMVGLKKVFTIIHERQTQEELLREMFSGVHFLREADRPNMPAIIGALVETLSDMYPKLEDFRLFVRQANTLVPPATSDCTPARLEKVKKEFYTMQANTKRKRLSADVEIKLRGIYFDRIERGAVEHVIESIYEHVASLEDIQFLVQYAAQVFPPSPADATGELVWNNIVTFQTALLLKREESINGLFVSLSQLYPEQETPKLKAKAVEISTFYQKERFPTKRELNSVSQIVAKSEKLFPPDFASLMVEAVTTQVAQLFRRTK